MLCVLSSCYLVSQYKTAWLVVLSSPTLEKKKSYVDFKILQLKDIQMLRQIPTLAHSCENRPKKLPCTPNERQIQKMKADMRSTAKVTNWPTRESHLYLKGCDACWLTHFHRKKTQHVLLCFSLNSTVQTHQSCLACHQ